MTGVTQVSCGYWACAGLKTDGSVIAWGSSGYGGDVQGEDVTGWLKLFVVELHVPH